jgi:hypothetical protein
MVLELRTESETSRSFEQWSQISSAELQYDLDLMLGRIAARIAEQALVYQPI